MKHAEALNLSVNSEFHTDDIAGVTPIFLHAYRIEERVLGIKNKEICILDEIQKRIELIFRIPFMF